jgi:hypothetical protein
MMPTGQLRVLPRELLRVLPPGLLCVLPPGRLGRPLRRRLGLGYCLQRQGYARLLL